MLISKPPSRTGQRQVSGHFSPEVTKALKRLAVDREITVQALLGEAINDLFAKHGLDRIADETPLPRGGAARRGPSASGS
ncbi:ribbon-helix-helix domain-containing protein [Mesorhizobium sp. M0228]|uniref:ribbon-helix-helix domain-containing protein n=1 Tax=Mesorhizobium sp. M0228 TaxID=2956923 RepID=UPI00333C2CDB